MNIDYRPISKFEVARVLKKHIPQMKANRDWVRLCIEGEPDKFPYKVAGKQGTIGTRTWEPKEQPALMPSASKTKDPLYLVNVPFAHRPKAKGYESVLKLLNLYKDESFGKTKKESREKVKERFALVIGINQILSIDAAVNQKFKNWILNIPKIDGLAYRIMGFFWHPIWVKDADASKLTYPRMRAFCLLRYLNKDAALAVRTTLEGNVDGLNARILRQVPIQHIRENILHSLQTLDFMCHMSTKNKSAPQYFGVMDSDAIHLSNGKGLFTRYDKAIHKNNNPSAISLGYSVDEENRPLIEFGVELDMACRAATTQVIDFGAYLPEPNALFCYQIPDEYPDLPEYSFLGDGQTLENRRLFQNGLNSGQLADAVFIADGGVVTSTPARMVKGKTGKVDTLTAKTLKSKPNLRSMHSIAQSHIFPRNWAENLSAALDFTKTMDAQVPMRELFEIYDPISRILEEGAPSVDDVLNNYDQPLTKEHSDKRKAARKKLIDLGMEKKLVNKIEEAAMASGRAIHDTYQKKLNELDFKI